MPALGVPCHRESVTCGGGGGTPVTRAVLHQNKPGEVATAPSRPGCKLRRAAGERCPGARPGLSDSGWGPAWILHPGLCTAASWGCHGEELRSPTGFVKCSRAADATGGCTRSTLGRSTWELVELVQGEGSVPAAGFEPSAWLFDRFPVLMVLHSCEQSILKKLFMEDLWHLCTVRLRGFYEL